MAAAPSGRARARVETSARARREGSARRRRLRDAHRPHLHTAQIEEFRAKIKAIRSVTSRNPTWPCPRRRLSWNPDSRRGISICGPSFSRVGRSPSCPGGLTRVALPEGSLVVNSSQGGGTQRHLGSRSLTCSAAPQTTSTGCRAISSEREHGPHDRRAPSAFTAAPVRPRPSSRAGRQRSSRSAWMTSSSSGTRL